MSLRYRVGTFVTGLVLAVAIPSITLAKPVQYPKQVIPTVGTCTVTEVLHADTSIFIHCQENAGGTWLMMSKYELHQPQAGDEVRYKMNNVSSNFYVEALKRTLPTMWQVFNYTITGGRSDSSANHPPQSASGREDGVYAGIDDSGTMVFSDNPGNVPKKKHGGKTKQKQ